MISQNPVFIPGPTNMPENVRKACFIPTLDHRSAAFADILNPVLDGVRRVLQSKTAQVFIFPSTGTGGWEIALTNTLSPSHKVLAARNGMFSQRWIDMCERHGLTVEIVECAWGTGLPADRYAEILAADSAHEIKAVLATHNETATGVRSDIAAVRRALDAADHPALFFVDGVSSIASMDFRFDDWGVDVAVTGSQKGFMLPPGLAITGFSARAMDATKTATLPRTFFDVRDMGKAYEAGGFPYTPPVGLMNGLKTSLEMLLDEGLDNVFARHHRIASGVRAAVSAWGLSLCAAHAGPLFRHRQRHPHPRRVQRHRHRHPCRRQIQCRLWHRPGSGRGQGLPHRAPRVADRRHDAFGASHRRDVHGRSGSAGETGLGRRRRAGLLSRAQYPDPKERRVMLANRSPIPSPRRRGEATGQTGVLPPSRGSGARGEAAALRSR